MYICIHIKAKIFE